MLAALRLPLSGALVAAFQMSQTSEFNDETAALRPAIRALIARVLGVHRDHPDVDDCTNDVYRRALEGRARLEPGRPLRPWLFGIARHAAIDAGRGRQRSRRRAALEPREDQALETPLVETLAHPGFDPEERVAQAELGDRVARALDALGADQRQVLLLFHVEGLGYREISERLGIPIGTVGTWVLRGRRALADSLSEAAT